MMWTQRPAPALSAWERAERAAAMEHAARLVARGASVSAAAEACGVADDALRHRLAYDRRRATELATRAPGRTPRWTPDEEARLAAAMRRCSRWADVAREMGTRSAGACEQHAKLRGMGGVRRACA